jgi:hydrogenase nickel incorporation protein HypA/HybF
MHELALMQSVAELALAEGRQRGAEAITRIHLRVGRLAGVDPQALIFAAEVVLEGSLAAGARLEIERVSGRELELSSLELLLPEETSPGQPT